MTANNSMQRMALRAAADAERWASFAVEERTRMLIHLDNEIQKNWFLESFPVAPYAENSVSTVGSEPYPEAEFDELLCSGGLEVCSIYDEADVLIIGREEWDEEDLNDLLDRREGQSLKVYSQEMFLAYWITGRDPFEDEDVARAFGEGHPALEYLSNVGFDWPSIYVNFYSGDGGFAAELLKMGLLSQMGYRVGQTRGLRPVERRAILETVFKYELPNTNLPRWYVEEWGYPKSKERLKKMADSLAAFCRREKKRNHNVAASDYEEDLKWLSTKNSIVGGFDFDGLKSIYSRRMLPIA
jgi:hypothetical protein